jgi:hypothetical protein
MNFAILLEHEGYQVWLRHGNGESWLFAQKFSFITIAKEARRHEQ